MVGTKRLHDELLAAGWDKTGAMDEGAYVRGGDRFLTWRRNGVLVATSGTAKEYDAKRGAVMTHMGCGNEITLEALVTVEGRRQGRARRALHEWLGMAARSGVTVFLEPVPLEEVGIDREALVRFYASAGFKAVDPGGRVMVQRAAATA